jgi:hypothetical protein
MEILGMLPLLGLGLVTFAALAAHFNSGTTRAVDLEHVQVVNSTSDPVPVTGTVKAAESGPWKVGIDGTPKVSVATTPPGECHLRPQIGINGTVPVQNARNPFGVSIAPYATPLAISSRPAAGVLVTSTPRTPAQFLPSPPCNLDQCSKRGHPSVREVRLQDERLQGMCA